MTDRKITRDRVQLFADRSSKTLAVVLGDDRRKEVVSWLGFDGTCVQSYDERKANAALYALAHNTANALYDLGYDPFVVLERLPKYIALFEAAQELHEVAELRGDNDLPHPADDPKLWTARMQDAWSDLEKKLSTLTPEKAHD